MTYLKYDIIFINDMIDEKLIEKILEQKIQMCNLNVLQHLLYYFQLEKN